MDRIEQNELDIIDIKKLTKFQMKQVVLLVEKLNEDNKETTADSFHICLKCGKDHPRIIKAGKTKSGKQMYLCHECGRRFVEDIENLPILNGTTYPLGESSSRLP